MLPSGLPQGAVADVTRELTWLSDLSAGRKPFQAITHCMCEQP